MECNTIAPIIAYAQPLFTFILVLITAWYAVQTQRMVGEMKKGRIAKEMPILICHVEFDFTKTRDLVGEFNNIIVQNTGNSPAIEAEVEVLLKNPETSNLKIDPQQWFLGAIGLNNPQSIKMKPCHLNLLKPSSNVPRVEITLTCKNVYRVISKTVSMFELQITEPPQAIEPIRRFHWVKLKETVDATGP